MALPVLEKVQILPERLGLDFFSFFLSRSNDDLHFLHTQNYCRINPHGATVSFTLLGIPVFPQMRCVKYGIFKNLQKIQKIKLKSFSLCQKMHNSSLLYSLQNLYFLQQSCTFASRGRPISPNFEVENFEV
jgi:hypothetical protein